ALAVQRAGVSDPTRGARGGGAVSRLGRRAAAVAAGHRTLLLFDLRRQAVPEPPVAVVGVVKPTQVASFAVAGAGHGSPVGDGDGDAPRPPARERRGVGD